MGPAPQALLPCETGVRIVADLRCETTDETNEGLTRLMAAVVEGRAVSLAASYQDDKVTVYGYQHEGSFIPVAIAITADIAEEMKPLNRTDTVAKDGKRS